MNNLTVYNIDGKLDFARTFSAGEENAKYYSGRRTWRSLSLFNPDLNLNPTYTDIFDSYPF